MTARTCRTAASSVRLLMASESKDEPTSVRNALKDQIRVGDMSSLIKQSEDTRDVTGLKIKHDEVAGVNLVTEADLRMTDSRTLDRGGMSSTDSGVITSSGWLIFKK